MNLPQIKDRGYWLAELQKLKSDRANKIRTIALRLFGEITPEAEAYAEAEFLSLTIAYEKWIEENHPALEPTKETAV